MADRVLSSSASLGLVKAQPRFQEVERKFEISDIEAFKTKLRSLGAQSLGTRCFTDVYYDTPEYALAIRDWWLRCRDDQFELKFASLQDGAKVMSRQNAIGATIYSEVSREEEIIALLRSSFSADQLVLPKPQQSLADWIESPREPLVPIADITTTRESFALVGDHNFQPLSGTFSIDVDITDYGYVLGEVEVVLAESAGSSDVDAINKLAELCAFVGIDTSRPAPRGKVSEYFARYNPELLALVKAARTAASFTEVIV